MIREGLDVARSGSGSDIFGAGIGGLKGFKGKLRRGIFI
jgi:hypothetical protein